MSEQLPFKERPHAVLRIRDKKGTILRHAVTMEREDGGYRARYDEKTETCEFIQRFENYKDAQAKRQNLQRAIGKYYWHGDALARKSIALPAFMPELPSSPRERREFFLSLDIEQQEEVFYAMTVATGLPRKRIQQWLFVYPEEIEQIDEAITTAARAELDLRIAKKMVGHALKDNSPASMTATLYLTKVFLGFNEQGMHGQTEDPMTNLNAAKSLFDDLTVVETHRDANGTTTEPPTVLKLVRDKKSA